MTTPIEAARAALKAIEDGWSFDRIDNEIAPLLRDAIEQHDRSTAKATRVSDDMVIGHLPWKWSGPE